MLTGDLKIEWRNYFTNEAISIGLTGIEINSFVEAAMVGINKYSNKLAKTIIQYCSDLKNKDADDETWITDSSVLMWMQHVSPPKKNTTN